MSLGNTIKKEEPRKSSFWDSFHDKESLEIITLKQEIERLKKLERIEQLKVEKAELEKKLGLKKQ